MVGQAKETARATRWNYAATSAVPKAKALMNLCELIHSSRQNNVIVNVEENLIYSR
jgi:hypothetical protein